jgi:uncharacterized protein
LSGADDCYQHDSSKRPFRAGVVAFFHEWNDREPFARPSREQRPGSKRQSSMTTIVLLLISNIFMTFAWYGHLKYGHGWPLWQAIAVSWGIALFEYCLAVPANRLGYGEFTGFQLKIIQEVATLVIFVAFAVLFLKEKFAWNYATAFVCLGAAAYFAFAFKSPAA